MGEARKVASLADDQSEEKEHQYLYSLAERHKLRNLQENQNYKELPAEDALSKQCLEEKSLVT